MKDTWLILPIEVTMMKLKGGSDWIEDLNTEAIDKHLLNLCTALEVTPSKLDTIMAGIAPERYALRKIIRGTSLGWSH